MELYHIKHQHQETENHLEHSFANRHWLHTRYKTQHLHHKTNVLPMDTHFKLHGTQLKQLTQTHHLHDLNAYLNPPRNMKVTIFHNNENIKIIISKSYITSEKCRENLKRIHTTITSRYLSSGKNIIVQFSSVQFSFISAPPHEQNNKMLKSLCVVKDGVRKRKKQ